ncbi:hypothetical protein CHELA20_53232 [Hyphomicrobiales bacterium]|nr:hypothetical protein CHELA41_21691 [Hyphomicrobiales bacterium]CAH1683838.1 hypothetical protein CHELA20_53232 [Hyphomicrobiales bacterium]
MWLISLGRVASTVKNGKYWAIRIARELGHLAKDTWQGTPGPWRLPPLREDEQGVIAHNPILECVPIEQSGPSLSFPRTGLRQNRL